jgi:primosomal protein N' (replication factor Y)
MLPDFRSSERTFQLLTQVAGRAGRGEKPGRVLIQTVSPDHPSVRFSKSHDFMSFYRYEIPTRQEYGYPPFKQLINFIVRSRQEKKAYLFARALRDLLNQELGTVLKNPKTNREPSLTRTVSYEKHRPLREESALLLSSIPEFSQIEIMGPAPLPFYKLRGHYRWHVMMKMPRSGLPLKVVWQILSKSKRPSGVAMAVDVDPLNIL